MHVRAVPLFGAGIKGKEERGLNLGESYVTQTHTQWALSNDNANKILRKHQWGCIVFDVPLSLKYFSWRDAPLW